MANPPPRQIIVRDERELREAMLRSQDGDTDILVPADASIAIARTLTIPASMSTVRVIGLNTLSTIYCDMTWKDWGDSSPANAIECRNRQAIFLGVRFRGFETSGAVIKGFVGELLAVKACMFVDIGTRQFAHRNAPPADASDSVYNSCINVQKLTTAHVDVANCRFVRCIHNNHRWSHVLYISARSTSVAYCQFTECGNPFAVGGKVDGASNTLVFNQVGYPAWQLHPTANRPLPPYLAACANDNFTFMFNNVQGHFYRPWTGQPDPARHAIDYNNYSAMRYSGQWAANTAQGFYIDWSTWLQVGFDAHSKPPTDLGVRMPE